MSDYKDIINLDHPVSRKHKPMSIYNRAAQFAPFAALTGYDEVIDETGRTTDSKIELDEYQMVDINNQLLYLESNPNINATFTYFINDKYKEGGQYITINGNIKKIDIDNHRIILNNKKMINIDDLISINY